MRIGSLIYDERTKRMDIWFGLEEYYGSLHCGVRIADIWVGRQEKMVLSNHLFCSVMLI